MKTVPILFSALLLPLALSAQNGVPAPALPTHPGAPAQPILQLDPQLPVSAQSSAGPAPSAAPAASGNQVALPAAQDSIRLNFQGAPIADVLNYLSAAAGFVIVQETPVAGTVNIVSQRPINADEAVDLLNAVLTEKGYLAIRNGRILKIVSSKDAGKSDLPVIKGSDPEQIPRKDNMVTQILPVRYVDVSKLVDNLRPLISDNATLSANDSSNAIILTDKQTNIHRMAEIIHALDTSISSISSIHVYPLRYADAKDLADVLTQLFAPADKSQNQNQNNQFFPPGFGRFGGGRFGGGGGPGGGGGQTQQPESEARQAAWRVVAIADEQSNSVVVSAPDEFMATVSEIVSRLDTSISDITETRIFRLLHADSTELATILNSLYSDMGTTPSTPGQNGNRNGQQQRAPQPQPQNQNTQGKSERAILQTRVVAVPDPRTNSVIVSASRDTMEEIALTVGRLDASDSKKQRVFVYTLQNADPDNIAAILRGMFEVNNNSNNTNDQPSASSRLNQRTTTGASSDVTNVLNTNSTAGGSGGGGGGGFR